MKKNQLILAFLLISVLQMYSQRTITGTIVDDANQPIIGANILEKGTSNGTISDIDGFYSLAISDNRKVVIVISFIGYTSQEISVKDKDVINCTMTYNSSRLEEVVVTGSQTKRSRNSSSSRMMRKSHFNRSQSQQKLQGRVSGSQTNSESYAGIISNTFKKSKKEPLSTFSIDVDKASYSNIRRFINQGQRPPKDAVRIEEMINYFQYDYSSNGNNHPITVTSEIAPCPWNADHKLLHIGIKAKDVNLEKMPASNLVFLIDVSGSMNSKNKLPLLQKSMKHLVHNLRAHDQVSIVTYAGSPGLVLSPTSGDKKDVINEAIDHLRSGGSTAGAAGINLAYNIASEHKSQFENSRVILATDGDFNVGTSSDRALQVLIEEKRKTGIYLTCLGFGMGNYKDSKLEILSNKGNGNYAYIDNINEGKRILGTEFSGTLFTIAKDVKIQVEFNPEQIAQYKLIGYENRLLKNQDFDDDAVDAGEIGLGHTVTALYELIPAQKDDWSKLRYSKKNKSSKNKYEDEVAFIKVRYKNLNKKSSNKLDVIVKDNKEDYSENITFSSAVALFGMILRDHEEAKGNDLNDVISLANAAKENDDDGRRSEFISLVTAYKNLE